jgi:hypothetical protein
MIYNPNHTFLKINIFIVSKYYILQKKKKKFRVKTRASRLVTKEPL